MSAISEENRELIKELCIRQKHPCSTVMAFIIYTVYPKVITKTKDLFLEKFFYEHDQDSQDIHCC